MNDSFEEQAAQAQEPVANSKSQYKRLVTQGAITSHGPSGRCNPWCARELDGASRCEVGKECYASPITRTAAAQESNGRGNGQACEAEQSPSAPASAALIVSQGEHNGGDYDMNTTPDHPDNNMLASLALDECASLEWWFKEQGHDEFSPAMLSLKAIRSGLTPFLPAAPLSSTVNTVILDKFASGPYVSGDQVRASAEYKHGMEQAEIRSRTGMYATPTPDGGTVNVLRDDDNYVAWCRYIIQPNATRMQLCDSDAPQAFKVYRHAAPQSADTLDGKYQELIYAVGSKWPNETRHQTALRYIRERENQGHSHGNTVMTGAVVDAAISEGGKSP